MKLMSFDTKTFPNSQKQTDCGGKFMIFFQKQASQVFNYKSEMPLKTFSAREIVNSALQPISLERKYLKAVW